MSKKYNMADYYEDELDYDDDYYEELQKKEKKKAEKKNAVPQAKKAPNTTTNANSQNKNPNLFGSSATSSKAGTNNAGSTKTGATASNSNTSNTKSKPIELSLNKENSNLKAEPVKLIKNESKAPIATIEEANTPYVIDTKLTGEIDSNEKPSLNLIVIGHVDAGKSTLLGHFLMLTGQISERQIQKFEKECKSIGKATFQFAWALDEDLEERKRGVTVDIGYKTIETEKFFINIMDAPGHRDFISNMISGACQADCALLIIDASPNSFEAGFFLGGQTREHAILTFALGVKQILVVVNKMETVQWSEKRFNDIKSSLTDFLVQIGFLFENINFIPVSGLQGTNLIKLDTKKENDWYSKGSLLDHINSFSVPKREITHPTRFIITDVGKGIVNSKQGIQIFGKLETGVLETKQKYGIYPLAVTTSVLTINSQNKQTTKISAGDSADFIIDLDEANLETLSQGMIISSTINPIPVVKEFTLEMSTLNIECPLTIGNSLFVHSKSDKTTGRISKIHHVIQGEKMKKKTP